MGGESICRHSISSSNSGESTDTQQPTLCHRCFLNWVYPQRSGDSCCSQHRIILRSHLPVYDTSNTNAVAGHLTMCIGYLVLRESIHSNWPVGEEHLAKLTRHHQKTRKVFQAKFHGLERCVFWYSKRLIVMAFLRDKPLVLRASLVKHVWKSVFWRIQAARHFFKRQTLCHQWSHSSAHKEPTKNPSHCIVWWYCFKGIRCRVFSTPNISKDKIIVCCPCCPLTLASWHFDWSAPVLELRSLRHLRSVLLCTHVISPPGGARLTNITCQTWRRAMIAKVKQYKLIQIHILARKKQIKRKQTRRGNQTNIYSATAI